MDDFYVYTVRYLKRGKKRPGVLSFKTLTFSFSVFLTCLLSFNLVRVSPEQIACAPFCNFEACRSHLIPSNIDFLAEVEFQRRL